MQQTDLNDRPDSLGYIYGNVTSVAGDRLLRSPAHITLVLLTAEHAQLFQSMANQRADQLMFQCAHLMRNVSLKAYDARCMPNGTNDYFRAVPCADGRLCDAENNADNVITGAQFTFRVREKYLPGFW